MRRSHWIYLLSGIIVLIPFVSHAATGTFSGSIISDVCNCPPKNGVSGAPDWGCVLQTLQNLIQFAVYIAITIMTLILAYAGILWITSPLNPHNREEGRNMILSSVIGIVIVLSGWLIIDFVMKAIYNSSAPDGKGGQVGPWNKILGPGTAKACIYPSVGGTSTDSTVVGNTGGLATGGTPTGGMGISPTSSSGHTYTPSMGSVGITHAAQAAVGFKDQICAAAKSNGLPASAANQLFGILGVESDGNPSAVSPKGAVGLMQMTTAENNRGTSLSTLTPSQKALLDPSFNIQSGVKYYAYLYNHFQGDVINATAGYNAGPGTGKNQDGSKQPFALSTDCPGQYAWECPINPGGFVETQRYIGNVAAVASKAGSQCTY